MSIFSAIKSAFKRDGNGNGNGHKEKEGMGLENIDEVKPPAPPEPPAIVQPTGQIAKSEAVTEGGGVVAKLKQLVSRGKKIKPEEPETVIAGEVPSEVFTQEEEEGRPGISEAGLRPAAAQERIIREQLEGEKELKAMETKVEETEPAGVPLGLTHQVTPGYKSGTPYPMRTIYEAAYVGPPATAEQVKEISEALGEEGRREPAKGWGEEIKELPGKAWKKVPAGVKKELKAGEEGVKAVVAPLKSALPSEMVKEHEVLRGQLDSEIDKWREYKAESLGWPAADRKDYPISHGHIRILKEAVKTGIPILGIKEGIRQRPERTQSGGWTTVNETVRGPYARPIQEIKIELDREAQRKNQRTMEKLEPWVKAGRAFVEFGKPGGGASLGRIPPVGPSVPAQLYSARPTGAGGIPAAAALIPLSPRGATAAPRITTSAITGDLSRTRRFTSGSSTLRDLTSLGMRKELVLPQSRYTRKPRGRTKPTGW